MASILTNTSAMVALQTLKSTNMNLAKTQGEISTGKTIATAKDNSAVWAISKVMESDVSGFKAVSDALALGGSTVAVASAGAEQINNILKDIKQKIVSATDAGADHDKITKDVDELKKQIASIVGASQFNGTNLLDNADPFTVLSSLDRDAAGTVTASNITVTGVDFTTGLKVDAATDPDNPTSLTDINVGSVADAKTSLGLIETYIDDAIAGAANLGASGKRIEGQNEFVGKLMDAMKAGIGSLVDADMEEASARLQALQVQQQLGVQSLSIANQSPQTILSLFR